MSNAVGRQEPVAGVQVGGYRLTRELGRGGMAVVYLGEHPVLGTRVAVKALHPAYASDAELRDRLVEEARCAVSLRHPALLEVFDLTSLPDGRPCFVMEYVDGETLEARIEREPVDAAAAVRWLVEIATALDVVHRAGIVHRDVKPQNVMLLREPARGASLKLMDFGIAKFDGAGPSTLPGTVLGTPHYMAPEQIRGETVSQAADVYALGVLAFRLLTGRLPFDGGSSIEVMTRHLREPPPELPGEAGALSALVRRALAKDPGARFRDAGAFREALQKLAKHAPEKDALHVRLEGHLSRARQSLYVFLDLPRDAAAPMLERAIERLEHDVARGQLATAARELLTTRARHARTVLLDAATRLLYDAEQGDLGGLRRALAAGLAVSRIERLHEDFCRRHPTRANRADQLLALSNGQWNVGSHERAIATLGEALAATPLSRALHELYWRRRRELARPKPTQACVPSSGVAAQ